LPPARRPFPASAASATRSPSALIGQPYARGGDAGPARAS
jgi:hypothetical protein